MSTQSVEKAPAQVGAFFYVRPLVFSECGGRQLA